MKARSNISALIICLVAFILSGIGMSAFAHTPLSSSKPAAGAELSEAPENLTLEFGGEVNLVRLSLVHDANGDVAIDFTPSAQKSRQYSIALPKLAAGRYSIQWAALGEDGHMVQGNIPFTLLTSP